MADGIVEISITSDKYLFYILKTSKYDLKSQHLFLSSIMDRIIIIMNYKLLGTLHSKMKK